MRLLFVDDEPRILEGLQRMLRKERREWEMVFALGSRPALEAFESGAFDLIITDMRMPEMDGATLLTEVQKLDPSTVRFLLSGQTEPSAALRAARVAHQFLTKPSSADVIREAVNRADRLRASFSNEYIRELVGGADGLPTPVGLLRELTECLERSDVSFEEIVPLMVTDVAISAKLLQLVNSSFFGTGRQIASARTAADLLGMNSLRNLVRCSGIFRGEKTPRQPDLSVESIHTHSLLVAELARRMAHPEDAEAAYQAGLLHDIGRLLLVDRCPDQMAAIAIAARERGAPIRAVERELLAVDHAHVGAYLLGLWNIPDGIVEAVAYHHAPSSAERVPGSLATIVHVADALVHEIRGAAGASPESGDGIDHDHLEATGMSNQLTAWRALAAASVESR